MQLVWRKRMWSGMAAGHRFAADAAPSSAALATEATMLEWTKLSQIKRPYEIWHSANANLCVEIRG
jgi:hypothetical protein